MKQLLFAAIACAVLTSCGGTKVAVFDGEQITKHAFTPVLVKIQVEFKALADKRDSIKKLPAASIDSNELVYLESQLRDYQNIAQRKFAEAVLPMQDTVNKKIRAAITTTIKEVNADVVFDISITPVQHADKAIDITEKIKSRIK
jgi:Skp family chaperone for outer membrane proteins